MRVAFLDLGAAYAELRPEVDAAVARVLAGGRYVLGPEVESFEAEFAAYCGARHCVGVGNGLDALYLILRALDIGPGDEVIVSAHTFIATWLAVSATGATPVPVEPDAHGYNIDAGHVTAAITPRTRAVIAVHLYGEPADIDPIKDVAAQHRLAVIEDAAQAHGARYRGRRTGGRADAAAFSFYPAKNLGALGDGGAVVTNDASLAARVRAAANYGSRSKYVHETLGVNSRLDELQAAVLRVKLTRLDEWNARRTRVAAVYRRGLEGASLVLPEAPDWAEPVWHLFVVCSAARTVLQRHLAEAGIETLIHYPTACHRQQAYAATPLGGADLPRTERLSETVLSLPIGPHITPEQIAHICATVAGLPDRGS